MTIHDPRRRAVAKTAARSATLLCAVALAMSVWGLSTSGVPSAAAATDGGPAVIVNMVPTPGGSLPPMEEGGSAARFSLLLPKGAACTGDSADGGYLVQSYLVTADMPLDELTFNNDGPLATDGGFASALLMNLEELYLNEVTAPANPAPGPGTVINIPGFTFAGFPVGYIPPGAYNIGIACTKGPTGPDQLDMYWNATIEIAADPADSPAQLRWSVVQAQATTTTADPDPESTTTSTGDPTDSTITTGSHVTTTTVSSTTNDPSVLGSGGAGPSSGMGSSLGSLPATGAAIGQPIVWAALLVVFGRMAVLLGRPPRVRPALAG